MSNRPFGQFDRFIGFSPDGDLPVTIAVGAVSVADDFLQRKT